MLTRRKNPCLGVVTKNSFLNHFNYVDVQLMLSTLSQYCYIQAVCKLELNTEKEGYMTYIPTFEVFN